ncbi:hypothetical protein PO909_000393 [Leuciscus waleckii]
MFLPITHEYFPHSRFQTPIIFTPSSFPILPSEVSSSSPLVKIVKVQRRRSHPRKSPTSLSQLGSTRGFKICHLNIQSFIPKLDEFKILLAQSKAHVMAISEPWLTPYIPDSFLSIENYELYRKDRISKIGGGVAFYVNRKYAHLISKIETETETLKLIVHFTPQHAITIIVTYKPPNVSESSYLSQLTDIIKSITTKELVILGDINLDWNDSSSKSLKNIAIKLGLCQLIKDPTRIGKTRSSILNLFLTNQPSKYAMSGVMDVAISDHSLIYAVRTILKSKKNSCFSLCTKNTNFKTVAIQC